MSFLRHLSFPKTREGKVMHDYLCFQTKKDVSKTASLFTDDAVFNGLLLKARGKDRVIAAFHNFVQNILTYMHVEALNEAGSSARFLVVYVIRMTGSSQNLATSELVSFKDGKICRIDSCFDTSKVSSEVKSAARNVSVSSSTGSSSFK